MTTKEVERETHASTSPKTVFVVAPGGRLFRRIGPDEWVEAPPENPDDAS